MKETAVIVVDAERCFYPEKEGQRLNLEGFGALGVSGAEAINPRLNELTTTAIQLEVEVVHTLDKHPKNTAHFADEPNYVNTWPEHGVDGTPGSLLHPDLLIAEEASSTEFIKGDVVALSPEDDTSYTGALAHQKGSNEVLPEYLEKRLVKAVVIGGLALGDGKENPLCVDSTAIDFKRLGFDVIVLTDATEAVFPENKEKCFRNLGSLGIKLMTTKEAIENLNLVYGD